MSECPNAIDCCPDAPFADPLCPSALLRVLAYANPASGGSVAGARANVTPGGSVTLEATGNSDITQLDAGADVIVCIDESAMPKGWINVMLTQLHNNLLAAGIGSGTLANRYGLVGFGVNHRAHRTPGFPATPPATDGLGHKHTVNGADWGTVTEAIAALDWFDSDIHGDGMDYDPASEDAYTAIHTAIADYTWRAGVAKVVLFITDEDRNERVFTAPNNSQSGHWTALKAEVLAAGVILVGVINQIVSSSALGIDYSSRIWIEAPAPELFTTATGGSPAGNANQVPFDWGTASAGAAGSLTDSLKAWTVNAWAGQYVRINEGTGAGQRRRIASNTATALTLTSNWSTPPDGTSQYQIDKNMPISDWGKATGGSATTLVDTGKAWAVNALQDKYVAIRNGSGLDAVPRQIASNTADTITIDGGFDFPASPDATTEYQIQDAFILTDPMFATGVRDEYTSLLLDAAVKGSSWNVNVLTGGDADAIASFTAALVDSVQGLIVERFYWAFTGWYENGSLLSTNPMLTLSNVQADHLLEARFSRVNT